MATSNSINNDIKVATGTSLNLGSSTTMTGMIDDDTFATASSSLAASSESIKAYVDGLTLGSGKIVQVVRSDTAAGFNTTSTSYVAVTNATASITPTSASNSILVMIGLTGRVTALAGENPAEYLNVKRDSTDITIDSIHIQAATGAGGVGLTAPMIFFYLDSPATTSSTTYSVYVKTTNASSTVYVYQCGIVLMELGA